MEMAIHYKTVMHFTDISNKLLFSFKTVQKMSFKARRSFNNLQLPAFMEKYKQNISFKTVMHVSDSSTQISVHY